MSYNLRFYGNLYNCPSGKRNPDCPVSAIQHLSFAEKVEWFDGLSIDEKEFIVKHHKKCISGRK